LMSEAKPSFRPSTQQPTLLRSAKGRRKSVSASSPTGRILSAGQQNGDGLLLQEVQKELTPPPQLQLPPPPPPFWCYIQEANPEVSKRRNTPFLYRRRFLQLGTHPQKNDGQPWIALATRRSGLGEPELIAVADVYAIAAETLEGGTSSGLKHAFSIQCSDGRRLILVAERAAERTAWLRWFTAYRKSPVAAPAAPPPRVEPPPLPTPPLLPGSSPQRLLQSQPTPPAPASVFGSMPPRTGLLRPQSSGRVALLGPPQYSSRAPSPPPL